MFAALERDRMTGKGWMVLGAVLGGLAVVLGAFGAHAVPGWLRSQELSEADVVRRLANWETAARYHMYHALAIMLVGWLGWQGRAASASWAGWAFLVGTLIFSGMLYALVLSGVKVLGAIVPIGGVLLIVGWALLAWTAWRL
jgi:uncharacterized membrane protein YgdD (TMEM256/DUF423 family)